MKFQPGDKVAFINEKQNGIVIKTLPGNKVMVEIEDGFEIEVSDKELVKTGVSLMENTKLEEPEIEIPKSEIPSSLINLCPEGSVCFSCVPAATGAILTGMVNYFLINNSAFEFVFTFHERKQLWHGVSRGVLNKSDYTMLASYKRENLTDVELFMVEGLLFSTSQRPPINHIRKEVNVILPGITHTLPGLTGVTAFGKVVELYNGKVPDPEKVSELIEKMGTKSSEKSKPKKSSFSAEITSNKYGVVLNEKVVDLHIEELTQDFSGLSNAEMLSIQLKRFSSEMDNAIKNHFIRIVFIHGIGNGVLKREIRNELLNYDIKIIRDGDFSKFGYGATEVVF